MAFFQNLFNQEFRGNWVLGDRQYSLTFSCPANQNSSDLQLAYNNGPWDFTELDISGHQAGILTLNYAWDPELKNYTSLDIDVTGENPSATTPQEVVNNLNSNETFFSMFTAELNNNFTSVLIKSKTSRLKAIRLWISNTGAEKQMRFNKKAGVAELPSYFSRHTIDNRFSFPDSTGSLILLDETDADIDMPIIEEAGFVPGEMKEDYELLAGRASGLFTFQKLTVDGNDRITQIIEYPAGAKVGDLARKINYTFSGANKNPEKVTEVPYILQNSDIVTP
jgi:hypothetical protein